MIKSKVNHTDEVLARIPWKIGGEIRNSTVRNYIATNIENGENIIATLLGVGEKTNIGSIFGHKAGSILGGNYLLVTDRKVVVIKAGMSVWATGGFGLKTKTFLYDHITSVDVSKGIFFGEIEIVTGGMVEKGSGGFFSGASKDSVIQFEKKYFEEVQRLAKKILELAQQSRESRSLPSSNDVLEQIRKLAELRDAGIITEEEFLEKKRRLLERI